ncbi:aldehyde dehydrogenase family protein, partial [Escherichia coli]
DVPANAKVSKEETFGPLAPLFRFKDEADVIAQANDTEFGLAAYFYARDLSRVFRVGEALEYGIVGIIFKTEQRGEGAERLFFRHFSVGRNV